MADNRPDPSLDTLDAIAHHLADAFETGEPRQISDSLATVADSKGLPELAAATGIRRDELQAALRSGELSLDTTLAIMKVIDLHVPPRR